ncbi:MAG: beta strand repeat-containing protein, partial [Terrimicrobiaceae bacterium]
MNKIHPPTASHLAPAAALPSHGHHLVGRAALLVCLFAGLLASQSFGTAISWNIAGDGNWSSNSSWTPASKPVSGDVVTFNNAGVNANETVYFGGNQTAASLVFSNTGTTTLLGGVSGTPANQFLTTNGAGTLITVNAGAGAVTIGDASASPTAAVNLQFTNGSTTITNNSTNLLTIANSVYLGSNTNASYNLTAKGPGNTTFLGNISNFNGVLGTGKGSFIISGATKNTVTTFAGDNSGMTGNMTTINTTGTVVGKTNTAFGINNTIEMANSAAYNSLVLATDTSDTWANNIKGAYDASTSFAIVSDRNTAGAGVTHTIGTITASTNVGATQTAQALLFQAGSNVTSGTAGLSFGAATFFSTGNNTGTGGIALNALSATVSIASISAPTPTLNGARTVVFAGSTAGNTVGAISDGTGGGFTTAIALEKAGPGAWTLTGNNTNTGATTLSGGTLILNYTNNTSKLANAGILTLNGGTLNLSGGNHTEAVASTTLGGGATSFIKQTSGTSTLAMGAITFTSGAVDFGADNIATTTSTLTNGILSQRATVAGANFAMLSNATITNGIVAYDYATSGSTGYTGAAMVANTNYALTAGGANTLAAGTGATTNTLKIANTATGSLAVGTNTLTLGALLFAGSNDYSITTSGAGKIVSSLLHNFGTGNLTLGALGGTLTQYGTGKTILSANATTNSALTINGGTVQFSNNLQIGTNTSAQTITLNNGTLIADTAGGSIALNNAGANSRTLTIGLGGGTFDVIGGNSLTISGVISGTPSSISAASYQAPVTFGSASSNGTFILSGANTYTGGTILAGGTTQVAGTETAGTSGPL